MNHVSSRDRAPRENPLRVYVPAEARAGPEGPGASGRWCRGRCPSWVARLLRPALGIRRTFPPRPGGSGSRARSRDIQGQDPTCPCRAGARNSCVSPRAPAAVPPRFPAVSTVALADNEFGVTRDPPGATIPDPYTSGQWAFSEERASAVGAEASGSAEGLQGGRATRSRCEGSPAASASAPVCPATCTGCPAAPAGPRRLRSRLPRAACRRALGRSREVHGIAVSQVDRIPCSHLHGNPARFQFVDASRLSQWSCRESDVCQEDNNSRNHNSTENDNSGGFSEFLRRQSICVRPPCQLHANNMLSPSLLQPLASKNALHQCRCSLSP
ncbi:uncharacterized protein LOC128311689 [Acinonyx jubatus]|uniref:Uncharacterized protein LOC128311689 n=1 Tax=Acinonyx jubatus TaxID=32536 RepID=A0ABM3NGQ4_ACIJB|nr:uncharacterized protein LOC128311689 [Acinonyx jubatus]